MQTKKETNIFSLVRLHINQNIGPARYPLSEKLRTHFQQLLILIVNAGLCLSGRESCVLELGLLLSSHSLGIREMHAVHSRPLVLWVLQLLQH